MSKKKLSHHSFNAPLHFNNLRTDLFEETRCKTTYFVFLRKEIPLHFVMRVKTTIFYIEIFAPCLMKDLNTIIRACAFPQLIRYKIG